MKDETMYGQAREAALTFARDEVTPHWRRARIEQAYATSLANGAF
jgi:hypothetical protein